MVKTAGKKNANKGSKTSKWVFIVLFLLLLWLASILIAGIISAYFGTDYSLESKIGKGNIAVIPVKGEIVGDAEPLLFQAEGTSASRVAEYIRTADKDQGVKAMLIEVNSPGGLPVASEEIMQALRQSSKLKVAVIRDIGASGAYWVASAADVVFASRMSITGSIGVMSSYLQFEGTMKKYGVTYERLVAGKYKDIGSPFRNLTSEEEAIFQGKIDRLHDYFLSSVAENRNLTAEQVAKISSGEFYLGNEAIELGLVDRIGSKQDAISFIEEKINQTAKLVEYKERRGLLGSLGSLMARQSFYIGRGIGSSIGEDGRIEPAAIDIRT